MRHQGPVGARPPAVVAAVVAVVVVANWAIAVHLGSFPFVAVPGIVPGALGAEVLLVFVPVVAAMVAGGGGGRTPPRAHVRYAVHSPAMSLRAMSS